MKINITALFFLILILKLSIAEAPYLVNHWLIWNVGQGQWLTLVENTTCSHFDFGGEVFSLKQNRSRFIQNCKNKSNQLYLSHADFDHYSFYNFILKNSFHVCWQMRPQEALKRITGESPFCADFPAAIHVLHTDTEIKRRNESSSVLQVKTLLIPGDSPIQKEKIWARHIPQKNQIEILILGHHGSQTSSSKILLSRLPRLKMAIASSRYKKYGHPHKKVLERLKIHHLNVIRTEDWGTLMIQ